MISSSQSMAQESGISQTVHWDASVTKSPRRHTVGQTRKWSGWAAVVALVVMTGLSSGAVSARADANGQSPEYGRGGQSGGADQYSQRRFKGRERGDGAWGRGGSRGGQDAQFQNRDRNNDGRGGSRNGRGNRGGRWNDQNRDPQGWNHGGSGGHNGRSRRGNQNGNNGWNGQDDRGN